MLFYSYTAHTGIPSNFGLGLMCFTLFVGWQYHSWSWSFVVFMPAVKSDKIFLMNHGYCHFIFILESTLSALLWPWCVPFYLFIGLQTFQLVLIAFAISSCLIKSVTISSFSKLHQTGQTIIEIFFCHSSHRCILYYLIGQTIIETFFVIAHIGLMQFKYATTYYVFSGRSNKNMLCVLHMLYTVFSLCVSGISF